MPTGVESWSNPAEIEAIYPFAGTEAILAIVGIVLWIAWHVLQTRDESREWEHAEAVFDERLLLPGADEPPHTVATAAQAPAPPPEATEPASAG